MIEGFANVFTGWNYSGRRELRAGPPHARQPGAADAGLSRSSTRRSRRSCCSTPAPPSRPCPRARPPQQDLADALDNIFNHPNVGPFISKQLIQKLVTSNPSPQYVARVTAVFNNDGSGKRGNLGAVVKAILLDAEARPATPAATTGKVKEPLLRLTQLWRAYGAKAASGQYRVGNVERRVRPGAAAVAVGVQFLQPVLRAARRDLRPGPGAPELQIATEYLNTTTVTNTFYNTIFVRNSTATNLPPNAVRARHHARGRARRRLRGAGEPKIADKLLGGQISPTLKAEAKAAVERVPRDQRRPARGRGAVPRRDLARIRRAALRSPP